MFDREQAIAKIEAGGCPCQDCRGQLTDAELSRGGWSFCKVCSCAWQVQTINGTRYAASIPGPVHTRPRKPNPRLTEADYDGHDDLR